MEFYDIYKLPRELRDQIWKEMLPCPRLICLYCNQSTQEAYNYYRTESCNDRYTDPTFQDIARKICEESRLVLLAHYHLLEHLRPSLVMTYPGGIDWYSAPRMSIAANSSKSDLEQSWIYIDGIRETIVLNEVYFANHHSKPLNLRRVQKLAFYGPRAQSRIERDVLILIYEAVHAECPALRTFSFILADSTGEMSAQKSDGRFCQLLPVNEIYDYEVFKVNFYSNGDDKDPQAGELSLSSPGNRSC
jgi:hypothetical protein